MIRILLPVLFFFMLSCQQEEPPSSFANESIFFDTHQFFEKEIGQLNELKALQKVVSFDDKQEEKRIEDFNLKEELSLFSESNINKTNWKDKYKVDTLYNSDNSIQTINHKALDDKLSVKSLTVNFQKDKVSKLIIEKAADTAIANSNQILTYFPGKGYKITNQQAIAFSKAHNLAIEVNYHFE